MLKFYGSLRNKTRETTGRNCAHKLEFVLLSVLFFRRKRKIYLLAAFLGENFWGSGFVDVFFVPLF